MRTKIKCFFGFHVWDKTRGWYDEPRRDAHCVNCGKAYSK